MSFSILQESEIVTVLVASEAITAPKSREAALKNFLC